jgi:hemerythrin-like domain-containing protein
MNAIELLAGQHREVEQLFERIRQTDGQERESLLEEMADALTVHAAIEERIFYPGVKRPDTEALLQHSVEEHLGVKRLLADMLDRDAEDDESIFNGSLEQLINDVKTHVEEEEQRLFPRVRSTFEAATLDELGDRMSRLAGELESEDDVSDHIYEETDAPAPI